MTFKSLAWNKYKDGLIPAIVQDANSGRVLMLGFMNQDALDATIDSQKVTFFSRTKERLWQKGETSGDFLNLVDIRIDCDQDTLLILANPIGNTCHLQRLSCFEDKTDNFLFLHYLETVIKARQKEDSKESYTVSLLNKRTHKVAQKVGEEGVEVALAALDSDDNDFLGECADLLFHLLVLLRKRDLDLNDVLNKLKERHS